MTFIYKLHTKKSSVMLSFKQTNVNSGNKKKNKLCNKIKIKNI